MKRINQRVMLTKRLLKDGLFRLIKEKDLDRITVSELCAEAGINRATFYKHYSSPRDVLIESGREFSENMRRATSRPDSTDDAERYLTDICSYLYDNSETVKIYIKYNTDDSFSNMLREFNTEMLRLKGEFTPLRSVDEDSIRLVSAFLGCGGYFLLREWLMEDIKKSPNEIAKLICGIFIKE